MLWIAPCEQLTVGTAKRFVFPKRGKTFAWREHDSGAGRVRRQDAIQPIVLIAEVWPDVVNQVLVAKAAGRETPAVLAESRILLAHLDAAPALRKNRPTRIFEPIYRWSVGSERGRIVGRQMSIVDPAMCKEIGEQRSIPRHSIR